MDKAQSTDRFIWELLNGKDKPMDEPKIPPYRADLPEQKKRITCSICGVIFKAKNERHHLCSDACRNRANNRRNKIYGRIPSDQSWATSCDRSESLRKRARRIVTWLNTGEHPEESK